MNPDIAADLLADLASGIPALPRAACRANREVFDSVDTEAVAQAVEICTACPEIDPCRLWAAMQPPRSLLGVVAGENHQYGFRNKTKKENS